MLHDLLHDYILWIIGGLFVFSAGIATVSARMFLIMFEWRREIDAAIAANAVEIAKNDTLLIIILKRREEMEATINSNSVKIAKAESLKIQCERNADDIRDIRQRVMQIANRRHGEEH